MIKKLTCAVILSVLTTGIHAVEVPIEDFSIKAYPQNINLYLPQDSADYTQSLLSAEYQKEQMQRFFNHYYATDKTGLSPWSSALVHAVLPSVKSVEFTLMDEFDNQKQDPAHQHFGENFKEHDFLWLSKISKNMALDTLNVQSYNPNNRAIAIANTYARALPDLAPDFYHFSLPGQGFPFDNLQESTIWVGTPLYVLHVSQDKAWSLVLTPDAYMAWIKSSDLAYASTEFIQQWQEAAQKGLLAVTQTESSVVDEAQHFLFSAYIGAVFPVLQTTEEHHVLLIPIKNENHQAVIVSGLIHAQAGHEMPMPASKQTIAMLIKQLQNRPYGWGGNYLFNDCSQELKSLVTPLGIWLPRNSAQQAKYSTRDLSDKTVDERLSLLQKEGHPLMTIIYINGHVMLYLGTQYSKMQVPEALTYQNVWGLSPATKEKRFIIGQSVLLPLLKIYPENPEASSLANKPYFKLIFLDALHDKTPSATEFVHQFMNHLIMQDGTL